MHGALSTDRQTDDNHRPSISSTVTKVRSAKSIHLFSLAGLKAYALPVPQGPQTMATSERVLCRLQAPLKTSIHMAVGVV